MGYARLQNAQSEVFFYRYYHCGVLMYTMTQHCVLSCSLIVVHFYSVLGVVNSAWLHHV